MTSPVRACLERLGLLFPDAQLERDYLCHAHYSRATNLVTAVVLDFHVAGTNNNVYIASQIVVAVATLAAGALMGAATLCGMPTKRRVTGTSVAIVIYTVSLAMYLPWAVASARVTAQGYENAITGYLTNYSNSAVDANFGPLGKTNSTIGVAMPTFTCTNATLKGDAYAKVAAFSRLFAFHEETLMKVLVCAWVCMQNVLVLNLVPARMTLLLTPVGVVLMLVMLSAFFDKGSLSNLDGSLLNAAQGCSNTGSLGLNVAWWTLIFEVAVSITAALAALLLQAVSRDRLKRELFFFTKNLDVRRSRARACCYCCGHY
jgi:hypothetical protein